MQKYLITLKGATEDGAEIIAYLGCSAIDVVRAADYASMMADRMTSINPDYAPFRVDCVEPTGGHPDLEFPAVGPMPEDDCEFGEDTLAMVNNHAQASMASAP